MVKFWLDKWCGKALLKDFFPTSFVIARSKESWVSNMWEQDGGRGVIGIPISLYTSLIRVKGGGGFLANSSKASSKAGLKSIEWLEPRSGRFSIKDFYYLLVPSGSKIFLTRVSSNSWIPIRVGFFAYKATWGRRLALDLSKRKKVSLLNKSYKCKKEEESINHMFLHCSTTGILQQLVFSSFKLKWVIHSSIKPMLQSWNGSYVGRRLKRAWLPTTLILF